MPNIASVLKSAISRIARKEIRAEVESLKKSINTHRTEIAALKRRSQSLEQELRKLGKASLKPTPAASDESGKSQRFSAKGLASQRQRLGLSAEALGVLLGASGQSVYNWEAAKVRPHASHLQAIAALKGLGKKQAAEVLASRRSPASTRRMRVNPAPSRVLSS
jgi:DNA-binding transcriptional regulator YiaG